MKKLFLFLPALLLSLLANATSTTISPESAESDNNIRAAFNGTADTIYLNPGEYIQANQIHFKRSAVLIAADKSNKPVIILKYYCDLINENSKVFVDGLIFDGSVAGQQAVRPYDAATGKEIHFNDCEFRNFAKTAISGDKEDCALDSCVVNNCKFINGNRSCIFMQSADLVGVKVTNSTFANITNVSGGDYASPIDVRSASAKVLIDHCTMYNCATIDANYNYINVTSTSDVVVSNCIFASAEGYDCCGTYLKAGGSVTNCLTYNLTNWQGATAGYGHDGHVTSGGATVTDCFKANPLFKNAAGGDFSLFASSPARGAGSAGSDLGDPRWYKALAPIAIPATLVPFDALLSEKASIIYGTPDSIFLQTESKTIIEWAKWKVSVTEDGLYDFTAYAKRTGSTSGQKLEIQVLNSDESETLKSKSDNSVPNEGTISSGAVNLVAGNTYVIKVLNNYDWAKSKLIKVVAAYAGGKTIAIPDTLKPVDAIRSERAFVNEDGELRFTDDDHTGYIYGQWGKWNISVAEAGKYKFTANVNSANNQNYRITLKNSDETSTLGTWYGTGNSSGERKIATEVIDFTIGNYVLMIEDTVKWSKGRVVNVVASYEGGKTVNAPGQILAKEAVICKEVGGQTPKMYHLENGDLRYDDNENNLEEYAYWNLNVTETGEMELSFNSPSGGHQFRFELYQSETLIGSIEESDANWGHNVTLTGQLTFPATGAYTLKLINKQQYSSGLLHSITIAPYVAPADVTMTDTDTDNNAWVANVGGATCDVLLNRTILGGMYNTICLPFALNSTQCKAAFGNDVELYILESATLSGDILNLQFATRSDIYPGTPILIKTSSNIVNPVFEGVTISTGTADGTYRTAANFKGTFVQKEFHNGDQVLLLVSNNMLAYPLQDRTLKGFRAYFEVNNPAGAPIRSARIFAGEEVVTDINLVEAPVQSLEKVIENGQLLIIRDGVRYNAIGVQVK